MCLLLMECAPTIMSQLPTSLWCPNLSRENWFGGHSPKSQKAAVMEQGLCHTEMSLCKKGSSDTMFSSRSPLQCSFRSLHSPPQWGIQVSPRGHWWQECHLPQQALSVPSITPKAAYFNFQAHTLQWERNWCLFSLVEMEPVRRSRTVDHRESSEGNPVSPDIVQLIKHRVCISSAAPSSLFVYLLLSGMLMHFLCNHPALSD